MSTASQAAPENSQPTAVPAVIRAPALADDSQAFMRLLPAWIISGVIHVVLLGLFLFLEVSTAPADTNREAAVIQTQVDKEDEAEKANLENEDIGMDPSLALNYNVGRIESVSVPGLVNPNEAVGIKDAPEGPAMNVPPPPGLGSNTGQGGALEALVPGKGSLIGMPGGMGGMLVPGGFGGRSGSTRERMLQEGGGNTLSEAAVARGQSWLVAHQGPDGRWSLDGFHRHGGSKCKCTGTGQKNDIAATAFGLLPLLGAGQTHKPAKDKESKYARNVQKALDFLVRQQNKEGYFGGGMYAHGLASIAVCEAYGLTSDPQLKAPAQRAINFIRYAQSESGGWRYEPRQGGDTSVLGWQVMALKSGQMAGLEVDDPKNPTFARATKWLNSCQTADGGGYGYIDSQATPTNSAVGLLCRQYLGWGPRNPGLIAGVNRLKQTPPGSIPSLYYHYYATQVIHHMGGEAWEFWNPRMRDKLIREQDQGTKIEHQRGSWSPQGDIHGGAGGRIMSTSLALLTLEVYYRHLPLYRRDFGGVKAAAN
jgi:hypothetical protein